MLAPQVSTDGTEDILSTGISKANAGLHQYPNKLLTYTDYAEEKHRGTPIM